MSENPTSLLYRAGVVAAVAAAALAMPGAALAHGWKKDDDDKGKKIVVCKVLVKKGWWHWDVQPCPPAPAPAAPAAPAAPTAPSAQQSADTIVNIINQPTAPVVGNQTVAAPAPAAPAAAPATIRANSLSGPCEARKVFRLSLYKGKSRSARVLLNGKAIPVTRGKKSTSVQLDLRGRANSAFTVRHTVVTKSGKLKTGTRKFRTCA